MPISFFKHIANADGDNVVKFIPPAALREYVEGYYLIKTGETYSKQLFFNDGYPVIAFAQLPGKKMQLSVDGNLTKLSDMWVCGGMLNNIYCESTASFDNLLVVRLYPLTFFKFFNVDNNCFKENKVFDLSEIAGRDIKQLAEAYYNTPTIKGKVQVVSAFLINKIKSHTYPGMLAEVLQDIQKQEVLTVKDLLNKYSGKLNYKWLERNFKAYMGISPKDYLLMKRFLNAYIDMDSCISKDLLMVAIKNGYYDDNHLIKEFKRFSGIPPKAYFQNAATM